MNLTVVAHRCQADGKVVYRSREAVELGLQMVRFRRLYHHADARVERAVYECQHRPGTYHLTSAKEGDDALAAARILRKR